MTPDTKSAIEAIIEQALSESDDGHTIEFPSEVADKFLSLVHSSRRAAWQGALDAVPKRGCFILGHPEGVGCPDGECEFHRGNNAARQTILTAALADGVTVE